jgi:hypothetical protein
VLTYTVTTTEKGAPWLEQHGIQALTPQSAKAQAISNAVYMGYRYPKVIKVKEETDGNQ